MWTRVSILAGCLAAVGLVAQSPRGPMLPPATLSDAPVGGDRLEFRELLSTTAQRICSRHTVDSSRTSATVLAIAASASATVPEYVRFVGGNNAVTGNSTTATLSGGGASDVGIVFVYARRSGTALTLYVGHNLPGATITCAGSPGCTVETGITRFPYDATPIYSWQVASGNWTASTGIDQGLNQTCWVDLLTFTNTTAGAITVTFSDAQGSAIDFLTAKSVAANDELTISLPGGMRVDAGATWKASANSSINAYARTAR